MSLARPAARLLRSSAPRTCAGFTAQQYRTASSSGSSSHPSPAAPSSSLTSSSPPLATSSPPPPDVSNAVRSTPASTDADSARQLAQGGIKDDSSQSLFIRFVYAASRALGYNSPRSKANRVTNHMFDDCLKAAKREEDFWFGECRLPRSFQSWFNVTNLYVYVLSVRLRTLPPSLSQLYRQQLIDHLFADAEYRIQAVHKIRSTRIARSTLKTMLEQQRGVYLALDQGLVSSDAVMAAALWRNVFGAGWARVGGVKGTKAPGAPKAHGSLAVQEKTVQPLLDKETEDVYEPTSGESAVEAEARFALSLERIVRWLRRETSRLESLSDEEIVRDRYGDLETSRSSVTEFSRL